VAVWEVLDEAERLRWGCVPFESVGPIRFGMSHDEVEAAVADVLETWSIRPLRDGRMSRTLMLPGRARRPAVTLYFTDSDQVFCAAVNGRCGPQVTLGGVRLVGRVPSEVETEFVAYADTHGASPRYSLSNDPAAQGLGIVLCAQRAGDVLVSRPVFVGRAWDHCFWDASESCIPSVEWSQVY